MDKSEFGKLLGYWKRNFLKIFLNIKIPQDYTLVQRFEN